MMCDFNPIESFTIADHLFEFNRSDQADELGLVIVPHATGIPTNRYFLGGNNHAYKIVGDELQVGTLNLNNCTPVVDNLAWPIATHFLSLNENGIIGIGDIRDGQRYYFNFDLTRCPVQLSYDPQSKRVLFTFACENTNQGACDPDHGNYKPNPCFSATLLS